MIYSASPASQHPFWVKIVYIIQIARYSQNWNSHKINSLTYTSKSVFAIVQWRQSKIIKPGKKQKYIIIEIKKKLTYFDNEKNY